MTDDNKSDDTTAPAATNARRTIPPGGLRVDLIELTTDDIAEAKALGISEEELKVVRAVKLRQDAALTGWDEDKFAGWVARIDRARAQGRGANIDDYWAMQGYYRDASGRFVKSG